MTVKNLSPITRETMLAAYNDVLPHVGKRQREVFLTLDSFGNDGATIWELVMRMFQAGIIPLPDRNLVHPRVNELIKLGHAEIRGKRECSVTGRTVAYYTTKG